ncbi:GntR family transcriptional regulator [Bacillus sp. M6-12]|uniref:GntR family transcriptional regulator n=1 Tax=Bacillus sp. M6-12 TaxID=2054166 RepID=UPI000C76946D|nr:GntR family transcriptional regulator [Bacillus sp. M6-12]PLS14656.1 GntR family transcriptional regulator [Bacillus sp. M6-12]
MPIPKNIKLQRRASAKDRALKQLRTWIVDGTLEPGEKLYDEEIAESIGVSRTPIREAMQILEREQLVSVNPGKATIVKVIEKEHVLKIYPTIAALHSLAAEEAAAKIAPNQIEELNIINEQYQEAILQNNVLDASELDEQFHSVIVRVADNPFILDYSSILQLHIRRVHNILNHQIGLKKNSVNEHQIIIQAFLGKNPRLASEIMKQNWLGQMDEGYALWEEGNK